MGKSFWWGVISRGCTGIYFNLDEGSAAFPSRCRFTQGEEDRQEECIHHVDPTPLPCRPQQGTEHTSVGPCLCHLGLWSTGSVCSPPGRELRQCKAVQLLCSQHSRPAQPTLLCNSLVTCIFKALKSVLAACKQLAISQRCCNTAS